MTGLVELLGSHALEDLQKHLKGVVASRATYRKLKKAKIYTLRSELARLGPHSPLRSIVLDPQVLRKVVKTKKSERHAAVAEYFALVFDTIAIQRSLGSSIPTADGKLIPLRGKFKNVICKTISPPMNVVEKHEYQVQHRVFAR